ncbi:DUF4268 domain-containing protein [uncultured Xylophilus sp.]|uniref:DUF4268 domain-containing protein n=1 Tax=uncultured Xylophilus sp. TaxID=296832 RepID=UPI0025E28CFE|nr:DUF4268 domain-containing protein [uncultured Xylophilus sp.]
MYRIDSVSNRIAKLKRMSFSALGLTERHHLQEWLAHQPDALGEELLIIQKEFDGFDDTKERLDLLALDKQGSLVIIENKLDDSGKDVVWQALKYASYCSTLSKSQVAAIFQMHLDKQQLGQNAQSLICDFLGLEDFDEAVINTGHDQRLIMVAAQFRKEVTSTVLWLLKHRVFVKCFRVTPFADGGQLFLSVEQVIPLPEAEQLMIGISEKEEEEEESARGQAARHQLRADFWHATLDALRIANVELYGNVSPGRDHWLNAGSGMSGIYYSMIFNHDQARVEFAVNTRSKDINKALFDHLFANRARIEATYGQALTWRRLEEKKVSLVEFKAPFDGYNRESWPSMIAWLVEHVQRMERTFDGEIGTMRAMAKVARASYGPIDVPDDASMDGLDDDAAPGVVAT